jgi:F-type H+-transporting ATPase subunit epsilon
MEPQKTQMAPMMTKPLQCIVVTPERAVLDETCDFVALPLFDGELGVLPGRRPMIGRLGFGELRTKHGNHVHRYYIDGGFVQIAANVVTVLTGKAIKAEEIKVAAVEEHLDKTTAAKNDVAIDARLKSQERDRAQIRVARHQGETTSAPGGH